MRIAVVGAGAWGTTIAHLLATKGFEVCLWCYEREVAEAVNALHENILYLRGYKLSSEIKATHLMEDLKEADLYINAVPVQYIRSVWERLKVHLKDGSISVVNLSKGIEVKKKELVHEILFEILEERLVYAVLSGPSFAVEVMEGKPTAVTVSSNNQEFAVSMRELFSASNFRVYSHDDVVGVEVAGALKNVIAIAAGICTGLGLGYNAIASLITRALVEIARFGEVLGAKSHTFFGLAGMGDLVLTCTGDLSRNRKVGIEIGKGKSLEGALRKLRGVAEGVETVRAVVEMSKELGVEMPISYEVYQVLFCGKRPYESIATLMGREAKFEFYWIK